ncbi:MAG: ArnT family glycosyltransferase [bacterium]
MTQDRQNWRRKALIFIAIVSAVKLLILPLMDLQPQDAYYWQYSRHLSIGYFDHPPVHAWTCWLTTGIFGDNAFGIRFGPWLYGLGLLILVFYFAERIFDSETGFWATVAAGLTPLFAIGSGILTPDPPLMFFWTLAVFIGYIAMDEDRRWLWLIAGFSAGFALLSKYTAVFLGAGFFLALVLHSKGRKHLATPWPYLALITAGIAFLPQIIWNAQNDWASFAFQSTRRAGELSKWRLDLLGGMFVAQLMLVSPVLFVGVIWASFKGLWRGIFAREFKGLYLAAFAVPTIIFFTVVALRYWVKMNWLAPAYITSAIAFVGAVIHRPRGKKFLKWGIGIAGVETVLLYVLVLTPFVPLTGESAYWLGWREAAEVVQEQRETMSEGTFIAGWGYKVPSELAFYLPDRPETHSNEIFGYPGLNYSYWTDIDELIGRDCIFVADDREPFRVENELRELFDLVDEPIEVNPTRAGKKITTFRIWNCYGYRGP